MDTIDLLFELADICTKAGDRRSSMRFIQLSQNMVKRMKRQEPINVSNQTPV